jgi:hypothetical protein
VLGGLLGAVGLPLVAFAIASGPARAAGEDALLGAGAGLAIGTALYCLGQVLGRLLTRAGEDVDPLPQEESSSCEGLPPAKRDSATATTKAPP